MKESVAEQRETSTVAVSRRPSSKTGAEQPCFPYLQVITGASAGRIVRFDKEIIVLGRDRDCDVVLDDLGVSRRHAQIRQGPLEDITLEDLQSTNGTFVGDERITSCVLQESQRISLSDTVMLKFARQTAQELDLAARLYESATRDSLTHLLNRSSFYDEAARLLDTSRRDQSPFSLIMLDVDHFKLINDTHGHPVGDAVLCGLADVLRNSIRLEDVVSRYGGEEFVVLLRDVALQGALITAERLRRRVESSTLKVPLTDLVLNSTVSLGAATWTDPESLDDLVARADAALYRAKQEGRNRVAISRN